MNNLKRVLSLGLTGTMLAGMMVMGAGAANVTDFTDASEIKNKDAVSTMAALGVINGKDTGAFDPAGNVTRGEMAKMLCVAMNGGTDPVLGTKTTPTYTDIKGHWAEKYIEYCTSLGYVAGRGDGTFAPDATVTSTEAAKIILGTLGYKADASGLTGMDWAINTNVLANTADVDLYDDLKGIDTTAAMNRDNAAQMMYNALDAKVVAYSGSDYTTSTYSANVTVKEQTGTERLYEMTVVGGGKLDAFAATLNGTKYASPADADAYAKATAAGSVITTDYTLKQVTEPTYSISNASQDFDETFGHKYLSLTTYSDSDAGDGYVVSVVKDNNKDTYTVELNNGMTFTKVDTDYSNLMGQKVKVLYKALDNVYGIYAHTDSEVLYKGVVDDISVSGTTLKIDSTVYKTDSATIGATNIYNFNDFGTSRAVGATTGLDVAANLKVIDNDGDGKIDLMVATPFVAAKVTYKGSDTVTLSPNVGGTSSFDLEDDINVYEGIAKNDYVVATPAANTVDGKVALVKAETVTGKIEGIKGTDSDTAKIDGTWYSKASTVISGGDTVTLNDTAKLVLVNGYYVYADINATTTKDLVVLVKTAASANVNGDYESVLVFTDGTTKTVYAHMEDDSAIATADDAGKFYTYEVDKSGIYELTLATTSNTGYDTAVSSTTNFKASDDKLADGTYIADDAVVIVRYKNTDTSKTTTTTVTTGLDALSKTSVITGKSLKGLSGDFGATSYTSGFATKVGGLNYVQVLFLAADAQSMIGGTADDYGYIVSAPYKTKEDSNTYIVFDLWNGSEVVTVKDKVGSSDTIAAPYVKGTVVSYSNEGSGIVDNVTANFTSGAVVGYNAGDKIISILTSTAVGTPTYADSTKVDSDTKYFYINSKDKKGVASEGMELATELAAEGTYDQNVWVLDDGNGTAAAIFVDVNNKLDGKDAADERVALTGINTAASAAGNWTFVFTGEDGRTLSAASEPVVAGETITVKATCTTAGAVADLGFDVKIGAGTVASQANGAFTDGQVITLTFAAAAGALTIADKA